MSTSQHAPVAGLSGSPERLEGPRDLAALHRDVWALLRTHPWFFVGLPIVAHLPFDALTEVLGAHAELSGRQSARLVSNLDNLIALLWGSFLTCMLLSGVVDVGEGRAPSLGRAAKVAAQRWGTVVGTTIVVGLLTGLSALLLLIPAFFFATRWVLAIAASAIDGVNSAEARARSSALVKARGTLRLFSWGVAMVVTYYVVALVPAVVLHLSITTESALAAALLAALTAAPINAVLAALAVGAGVLYLELSGRPLLYPVGLGLVTDDGRRVAPPAGTGAAGLAIVSVLGGVLLLLALPIVAIAVYSVVDAPAAEALLDASPALAWWFGALTAG